MKITSPEFAAGGNLPRRYTRDGEDKSPPLHIEGVPEDAKSLVLIVDDPDAPGGIFTHWVLFNINPKTSEIRENSPPVMATQGRNDWGEVRYGGPQPPSGEHRYFFRLYALDTVLASVRGARRDNVEKQMSGHILEEAELMGRYASDQLTHTR